MASGEADCPEVVLGGLAPPPDGDTPRRASVSDDGALPWELIDALLGGTGTGGLANGWGTATATSVPAHTVVPAPAAGTARLAPTERPSGACRDPRPIDGGAQADRRAVGDQAAT